MSTLRRKALVSLVALGVAGAMAIATAPMAAAVDPNYMPNGCKAGQRTYQSFTRGIQPCNQWPAYVRRFGGGGTASSSGVTVQADQNYMPNGCKAGQRTYTSFTRGTQPCAQWPAYVRRFGGGGTAPAPVTSGGTSNLGSLPAVFQRIVQCESGGNPRAQNPTSSASGLFQFIDGTWANFGGYAHAKDAPVSVQIAKAEQVYAARGTQPWNASRSCWA